MCEASGESGGSTKPGQLQQQPASQLEMTEVHKGLAVGEQLLTSWHHPETAE
jgi:hypothetical protein